MHLKLRLKLKVFFDNEELVNIARGHQKYHSTEKLIYNLQPCLCFVKQDLI